MEQGGHMTRVPCEHDYALTSLAAPSSSLVSFCEVGHQQRQQERTRERCGATRAAGVIGRT